MKAATTLWMTVMLCVGLGQAQGAIFEETFEDYDLGSDIRGQGGWEANTDGFVIGERDGDYLLDGIGSSPTLRGEQWVYRQIDHSGFNKVILNAKLFSSSDSSQGRLSTQSGIGFGRNSDGRKDLFWTMSTSLSAHDWLFDARALGVDLIGPIASTSLFNQVIDVSITLDKTAETVFGFPQTR